jgi:hypothetical protein
MVPSESVGYPDVCSGCLSAEDPKDDIVYKPAPKKEPYRTRTVWKDPFVYDSGIVVKFRI